MELETHLIIADHLGYLGRDQLSWLSGGIEEIGKMLNGLIQSLRGLKLRDVSESLTPNP